MLEFPAIAVDASCTHMYAPGTRRHIRKALELGATRAEIAAVLQAVSVLGIHSASLGMPMLLEELAALEPAHSETRCEPPRPEAGAPVRVSASFCWHGSVPRQPDPEPQGDRTCISSMIPCCPKTGRSW